MTARKIDVVYILKEDAEAEELRYSLRSVEQHFPHKRIVFYGGQPAGLVPDLAKPYKQKGATKWERVRNTLVAICEDDDLTEDFWLFNDDFFVMQKTGNIPYMVGGSIWYKIGCILEGNSRIASGYVQQLRDTARTLRSSGYDRLNYALHLPMRINRAKGLETLKAFPKCPMFRSLYGNHHKVGGILTEDVKIQSLTEEPTGEEVFLSTNDENFRAGEVGEYIRAAFPERSKWEQAD